MSAEASGSSVPAMDVLESAGQEGATLHNLEDYRGQNASPFPKLDRLLADMADIVVSREFVTLLRVIRLEDSLDSIHRVPKNQQHKLEQARNALADLWRMAADPNVQAKIYGQLDETEKPESAGAKLHELHGHRPRDETAVQSKITITGAGSPEEPKPAEEKSLNNPKAGREAAIQAKIDERNRQNAEREAARLQRLANRERRIAEQREKEQRQAGIGRTATQSSKRTGVRRQISKAKPVGIKAESSTMQNADPSTTTTTSNGNSGWREELEAMKNRYSAGGQTRQDPELAHTQFSSGSERIESYKSRWISFAKSGRLDDEAPEIIKHVQLKFAKEARESLDGIPGVKRYRLAEMDEAIAKAEKYLRERSESFGPKDKSKYPKIDLKKARR